jgi:hypothetical protein
LLEHFEGWRLVTLVAEQAQKVGAIFFVAGCCAENQRRGVVAVRKFEGEAVSPLIDGWEVPALPREFGPPRLGARGTKLQEERVEYLLALLRVAGALSLQVDRRRGDILDATQHIVLKAATLPL